MQVATVDPKWAKPTAAVLSQRVLNRTGEPRCNRWQVDRSQTAGGKMKRKTEWNRRQPKVSKKGSDELSNHFWKVQFKHCWICWAEHTGDQWWPIFDQWWPVCCVFHPLLPFEVVDENKDFTIAESCPQARPCRCAEAAKGKWKTQDSRHCMTLYDLVWHCMTLYDIVARGCECTWYMWHF